MKPLHILSLFLLLAASSAHAQIRSSWFDINPNQSGLDPSDPNGASGGRVNGIGGFADMSIVFVASEWGGLWSSVDQGNNWFRVRSYQPTAMFDVKVAAATDIAPNGTIYASSAYDGRIGTNTLGNAITQSGLAFSRNRGSTWLTVPLPTGPCIGGILADEPSGWNIAIRANNPRHVYVGTNCGLLMTVNGGINWAYVDPSPADSVFEPVFGVVAPGGQGIAVISQNGFFSSADNGVIWAQGGAGLITGGFGDLAVSPFEPNVLYAAVNGRLLESADGGATWPTSITLPFNAGRTPFVATNRRSNNRYDLWYGHFGLARAACTAQVPAVIGGPARAPTNSWASDLSKPNGAHNDMSEIFFDPRPQVDACPLLVGSDGGVYRNTDRGSGCQNPSWEQPNVSPHGLWLFGFDGMIGNNGADQLYFGLQDNGVWGTTNAPRGAVGAWPVWDNEFCCDGFGVAVRPGEVHDVEGSYGSGRAFQLHRSGEGFAGKGDINTYPTNNPILTFTSGRAIVSFGPNSLLTTFTTTTGPRDNIYFSTNMNSGSINWTSIGFPGTSFGGNGGLKASASGRSPVFFFHAGNGQPYNQGDIAYYNGAIAGNTWNLVTRPTGATAFTVYDVDPNNCRRMMASAVDVSGNFRTWRTNNLGSTWTNMPALDNLMIGGGAFKNFSTSGPRNFYPNRGQVFQPYMFEINPVNSNIAVAGAADAGIFLTTDFGNNWVPLTNPTNPTSVASVGVNVAPHIPRPLFAWFGPSTFTNNTTAFDVWIGTQGGGVHKFLIETP
jgi:photosystem II stability/assembly factor-like uncharacterized protein